MELYLRILLCILLATSSECKTNLFKDLAKYIYDVFTLGLDLSDRLEANDELEKVQESINKLKEAIERVHNELEYTNQLVEDVLHLIKVQSYYDSSNHHIEQIDRCITKLQYVFGNPTDMVLRENFEKCYDINTNVQVIGGYLSGKANFGSKPLFDYFYNEDGSCKGEDIEKIFRALYEKFFDGCIVTSTAERMKHNNSSSIYRDECWEMNRNISAYMISFYGKCIELSCSSFHSRISALLKNLEKVNSSTVYNVLRHNYPWLQFSVIEVLKKGSVVKNNGTFFLNSGIFVVQNKIFLVFWTDVFVMFSKNRTNENQKNVNITVSYQNFESWFLGMNLSYENPLVTKRISAFGYTSNQTIDTCKYFPVPDSSPHATPNSGNSLRTPALIFFAIFLVESLKSLCYF